MPIDPLRFRYASLRAFHACSLTVYGMTGSLKTVFSLSLLSLLLPVMPVSARSDADAVEKAAALTVSRSGENNPLTSDDDETQTSSPAGSETKPDQSRRGKLEAERIAKETREAEAKSTRDSRREALRAWQQEVKVWHKSVQAVKRQTKVLIDAIRKESDILLSSPTLTAEQKALIQSSQKNRIKLALSFAQESIAQLGAPPPKPAK